MSKINKLFFTFWVIILGSCATNVIDDTDKDVEVTDDSGPVVAGRDYPMTETTEEYSVTYQYKKGVIVLDEKNQTYLVKVEADTVLYFSHNTPSSILPKVGDVLSSRATKKTPFGLGNIVLEKSESEGMIRYVTTVTSLDNIFKELTWEYNAYITDSILSGYTDEEGNTIEPSYVWYDSENDSIIREDPQKTRRLANQQTRATIGNQKLISFPLQYNPKHGSHDNASVVNISGEISIGAFVHCSGDVQEKTFNFYVQPIINIEAGSKLGIMYNPNLYQDIFPEWSLFKLKDIIKGFIQLGPVTLRPYADVEVYVDFGASGTIDLKFGKTFSAKIGYSQQKGAYIENTTSDGPENKFIKSIVLDGNISIGIKSIFDIGCGLYSKNIALELNPYFKYSLNTDLRLTGNDNGWSPSAKLNFDINVGANGRLVINLFGDLKLTPTLKFFDTKLFHKEWPLMPTLYQNSFSVQRDRANNVFNFNAKYDISGGLLSLFSNIYPGIALYKDGVLVYKKTTNPQTSFNKKQTANFILDGLQLDASYTAKPIITVFGIDKTLEGKTFSILCPNKYHPHAIDLGNGIKYACCNVGATNPAQYGNYYEWKESPSAVTNFGAGWKMPSLSQLRLLKNCSHKWTSINGVNGMFFIGNNDASVFLPAAGIRLYNGVKDAGVEGHYWASEVAPGTEDNGGYMIFFDSNGIREGYGFCNGYSIRPIAR